MKQYLIIRFLALFLISFDLYGLNLQAIDFGNYNVRKKPYYVVADAAMTYNPSESAGVSDLQQIRLRLLWDQFKGELKVKYIQPVATPDFVIVRQTMERGEDREWRARLSPVQTLNIYSSAEVGSAPILNRENQITLSPEAASTVQLSLNISTNETYIQY